MIRKIISLILVLLFALTSLFAQGIVFASDTEYAITSHLNSGWKNENADMELVAYASLGENSKFSGMKAQIGDEPSSLATSNLMGKEGWVLSPNKGNKARYINIDVDNDIAHNVVDGTSYAVEIDYFDSDNLSSLAFIYEAMDYQPLVGGEASSETSQPALFKAANIKEGEYLYFKNTGTWRTYRWFADNPKFSGGLDGFDMRVGIYSDTMNFSRGSEAVISQIRIYKLKTASRVEISGDTQEHLGNIFFDGEDIELAFDFSSTLYPHQIQVDGDYPIDVVYTAKNEDGDTIWTGTDSFSLPKLDSVKRNVSFKVDKYGIYRFDVEAYCSEKNIYSRFGTEFSYVRSDKGKTVNPKAGINIGLVNPENEKIAQFARNLGVPNVRMMLYYYNWRKSAEKYEVTNVAAPEGYKSLFRAFKKAGLEINANLHSASWMGAAYNFSPIERTPPYTEEGLRRWGEYCARMAMLFGDTVDQFEIWNEYNLGPNHSFNRENRPASDYGKMYEISKAAIKSVNPDIPVIGLNTSGAPLIWTEDVLKSGATDMDIFAIHPYRWYGDPLTYNGAEDRVKPIAELFEKYGVGDVPIWAPEYGYSSHFEDVNTDLEQGLYNVQAYALIMATEEIDRYYFFCLLDKAANNRTDRETNFGFMRDRVNTPVPYIMPYAAKPAYLMVSHLNMMYHDAEYINTIELGKTGRVIRNKHLSNGEQFAIMFSNKENGELVTLNLGINEITLYDAYGNATKLNSDSGIYSFDLSKRVQYIEGDFKSFDRVVGGVYPETVEIKTIYGENARIPVVNYSGHDITAVVTPLFGSEAEGTKSVIKGEGGYVEIKGGNAVSGTERVKLTLYDDKKVYFNGYVYLAYEERVKLTTTLIPLADGWSIRCTVTNMSDDSDVSGYLTLTNPSEWKDEIADINLTLRKGEEKSVDIPLPVPLVSDERVIEMGFVIDDISKMGSYVSQSYNFSAAMKADKMIIIDADKSEWTEGFMTLNRNDQFQSLVTLGNPYAGPDDLSAQAAIKYDDENFYFFADVVDNVHFASGVTPVNIWQMDSIQLALVYDPKNELDRSLFEEVAICLLDGKPLLYRHKTRFTGEGDFTTIEGYELAIKNEGVHTYYELKIPWSGLMTEKIAIEPGTELKFSMVVNENDGVGRVGYMTYGEGIVSSKNSNLFKRLYIRG